VGPTFLIRLFYHGGSYSSRRAVNEILRVLLAGGQFVIWQAESLSLSRLVDGLGTPVGTLAIPLREYAETTSIVTAESADFRRNSTNEGGGLKNRHRLFKKECDRASACLPYT
jgi:hypothetical protein